MFLSRMLGSITIRRRKRIVTLEINALSDHRLNDLGLSRLDLIDPTRRR
jgi:uncharacterized protein YjiS (DUF1127 family)